MFEPKEVHRFSRQISLIGAAGQQKLKESKILLVGLGGLGSPAATYLAAAGIGQLGLVDFDLVDLSNLPRQILFSTADLGQFKTTAAAAYLQRLQSHTVLAQYPLKVDDAWLEKILPEYDLVVDATDNLPTKHLLNQACVRAKKALVTAGIYQYSGQVGIFQVPGPCWACVFPPTPSNVNLAEEEACSIQGVLGPAVGVLGSWQALLCLQQLLGQAQRGKILCLDFQTLETFSIQAQKNPHCLICGDRAGQKAKGEKNQVEE